MNLSAPFIRRPVATTLLTVGVALAGVLGFGLLPVAPLPNVDFPTISVSAALPGASPETMAATVATPLERQLGRIAGVTEMSSSSSLGSTRVILQFDLDRDIDGAARDVQAAINAARSTLPTTLPSNPTYRKVNPADAPIMILALTSDTLDRGQMYDQASTIIAQELSQLKGIGEVDVSGSSLPAVRVELNPAALNKYGVGLEQVRAALAAANANRPKGAVEDGPRRWQLYANDQAEHADAYRPLIVAWRDGAPVRLSDVGEVLDSVQDLRNAGSANGKPAVLVILRRQPGANIIETVDRVQAVLPQLSASIPRSIDLSVVLDRTPTIRASLRDVEGALLISMGLVVLVVFLFLRNARAALVPSVAVPVSIIGTFGVMYLFGYSLDNLSLMALAIATGFVVDDAIVVLENISRHIEGGTTPYQAALAGAREVGFTVLSMSLSLIAVFIPILLMGGIVGRLFREFAVTLSIAIGVSLLVSLTATPMMCSRLLKPPPERMRESFERMRESFERVRESSERERESFDYGRESDHARRPGRFAGATQRAFERMLARYGGSLGWALRHSRFMLALMFATIALNVWLYLIVPKGFFPQQDTGRLIGSIQADQSISFQAMQKKLADFITIIRADPAVAGVVGFTGGGQINSGFMFITLKPLDQRRLSADGVIARLRVKLAQEPGASLFLQSVQDIRVGGRQSNAQYQYTLQGDDLDELYAWAPRVEQALSRLPQLVDVNSDQQNKGSQASLAIDRPTAARLGVTTSMIDATLYDAFGQRQVSTIYSALNQYHVVMEVAPRYWQRPESLDEIYVSGTNTMSGTNINTSTGAGTGALAPLAAFSRFTTRNTTLAVNHQGQFAAATLSFNLPPGVSLSGATAAIDEAMNRIGVPASIHGSFQGTAQVFQQSLASEPWLILAALVTIYIVLGILYESYVHPITILSTLPSAGVGAVLALLLLRTEFSLIALIGVILLIGIVKKNAIMMIDVALDLQRRLGQSAEAAIHQACLLRFRPIMMTTMAAMLGALPLALMSGNGAELRRPLGISIVGGLLVSQALTLYTTPVVYLYMDRLQRYCRRRWAPLREPAPPRVPGASQ